jgi:hypothetical protein
VRTIYHLVIPSHTFFACIVLSERIELMCYVLSYQKLQNCIECEHGSTHRHPVMQCLTIPHSSCESFVGPSKIENVRYVCF